MREASGAAVAWARPSAVFGRLLRTIEARPPRARVTVPPSVERLRLLGISFALGLLIFAQSAGSTEADTKIDLAIDPAHFLGQALTLWVPVSDAGQLQNQAYGYLFPMGPFFAVFHILGLAPWSIQRLWQSVLVVTAFLGMVRLARLLGVVGFWPQVAAGLTYALAPPIVIELSTISAQLMPTAALPWIIVPLVQGASRGSPRRAAARSGVALLFAGGVNAAATLAVLPVPALWLLTRGRGPRRAALLRWWALAVILACAWWAFPLLVLGRYSPPFLNWIESAQNTTATTSMSAVLRGVEHWESYLGPGIWPAGWIMVTGSAAIIATTAVAAAGLAGLARRGPDRLFLFSSLVVGLVVLTFGHVAPIAGPFAGSLRNLLDGPLVAFRNIHKFDPLIRLPIAIGVGACLSRARVRWWTSAQQRSAPWNLPKRVLIVAVTAAVGAVAIAPALVGRMAPDTRANTLPSWWRQTGQWLAAHDHGTRALVVPGAQRPMYFWGSTVDDALQPVTNAPWLARSGATLAGPGTIRLLDAIEQRLAHGHRDAYLAPLLARFGIGSVVLRNDLDTRASNTDSYNVVRTSLLDSPGVSPAAGFGPMIDGEASATAQVDGGAGVSRPAVEIFRVTPSTTMVSLLASASTVYATGSSDALPSLVERGLPAATPVRFATGSSSPPAGATVVATDGIRRQQAGFGNARTRSATLTPDGTFVGKRAAYDYLPDPAPPLSTMHYLGIADVTASSSGADVNAVLNASSANGPWAALDGVAGTAWRSGDNAGAVGQWLQVRLDSPISVRHLAIAFAPSLDGYPSSVEVRGDHGHLIVPTAAVTSPQTLPVPAGRTRTIRITVRAVSTGGFGSSVGISSLTIPGVHPQRTLDVPVAGSPHLLAFDVAPGFRSGCLDVHGEPACDPSAVAAGEEDDSLDRTVRLSTAAEYVPTATVRLKASTLVDARLDAALPVRASASSVLTSDPRLRPGAAVDDDPASAWSARPGDQNPTLTLSFPTPRLVSAVVLSNDVRSPVAAPTQVLLRVGPQQWTRAVPDGGVLRLPRPTSARSLSITILAGQLRTSFSTQTGVNRVLPAGLSSVRVEATPALSTGAAPTTVDIGCDAGLRLIVDGVAHPMQVHAPVDAVLDDDPVEATGCAPSPLVSSPIALDAGKHRFTLSATSWAAPQSLTLTVPGASLATTASHGTFAVRSWGATSRRVRVDTSASSVLAVKENFNSGWQASVNGHRLTPILNDGWQQAFVVPAGTHGVVDLDFAPQSWFRAGLLAGLVAALAVVALAFWRRPDAGPRKPEAPPVREFTQRRAWSLLSLAAVGVAVAGLPGLGVVLAVAVAQRVLWPPGRTVPGWIAAALLLAVGLAIAAASSLSVFTTANSGTSQLLTLAAVCFAVLAGLPDSTPRQGSEP